MLNRNDPAKFAVGSAWTCAAHSCETNRRPYHDQFNQRRRLRKGYKKRSERRDEICIKEDENGAEAVKEVVLKSDV